MSVQNPESMPPDHESKVRLKELNEQIINQTNSLRQDLGSVALTDFGGRMRMVRELSGISQADLSVRSGLHPSAVSHFEIGGREPSLPNVRRICLALGCSADILLGLPR